MIQRENVRKGLLVRFLLVLYLGGRRVPRHAGVMGL